jgi:hypothetical protein
VSLDGVDPELAWEGPMVNIVWNVEPHVPADYRQATVSKVDGWINRRWQNWKNGQRYRVGLNVDAASHRILIGVRVTFRHPEGHPASVLVTQCDQLPSAVEAESEEEREDEDA